MFGAFFRTFKKVYISHNLVLWLVIFILPVVASLFMVEFFSARIIQHIPIGILRQESSVLTDRLEKAFRADPVLDIAMECEDLSDCEHGVIRGDLQAFVVFPHDLERRALRLESPVIAVYSSGQNYLTNSVALKEIRTVVATVEAGLFSKNILNPVQVEIQSVGNVESNYQGFLGLGLVTAIFHLASILGAVYVFSFPFRDHTVRRYVRTAGGSRVILGLATIVPLVIIQWISFMAVYAYAHRLLAPMSFDEFIMTSAGQLAMILACSGVGASFVGITGNMRMATSVAGVIGGPAFAFAGQTFPVMSMPLIVRWFSGILPLTHILRVHSAMLLGPVGKAHAWEPIAVLLFMAVFWHLLGARLLFLRWKVARAKEYEWARKNREENLKGKIKVAVDVIAEDLRFQRERKAPPEVSK